MRRRYIVTLTPPEVLERLRARPQLARSKILRLEPGRGAGRWRVRFTRARPPFELYEWVPQRLELRLSETPRGHTRVDARVVARPSPKGIGLFVLIEPLNFGGGIIGTAIDAKNIMQRRRDERAQLIALIASVCIPHEVDPEDRSAFRRAPGD